MKVQPQTERPFLLFTHTHSFPLYVSVSLFLWQSKPDASGQGGRTWGDGGSNVCMRVRQCVNANMCVSVHAWVGRDQESDEKGERREGTCHARSQ